METIERSSRSYDGREYDQATALYLSIARRRASRFMKYGRLPGLLCLVSSRRYPGQFTDRKEPERRKQLAETGTTSIYLSLIKIDVQGAEERVLDGAGDILARQRVPLFIEVHDPSLRSFGSSARHLVERLVGMGYTLHALEARRLGEGMDAAKALAFIQSSRNDYADFLCLPPLGQESP